MAAELMTPQQRDLYDRLTSFDVDGQPFALSFTARLARENGWSHDFARRVVTEYKKFVFLAMEAGHPVTPSDEVDQAWHLHMTYTQSYSDRMCMQVLSR